MPNNGHKYFYKEFNDFLEEYNMKYDNEKVYRSLYSLRHTYATLSLLNGVDIHLLSRQLGTSIHYIEKHYSHIIPKLSADILAGEKYKWLDTINE